MLICRLSDDTEAKPVSPLKEHGILKGQFANIDETQDLRGAIEQADIHPQGFPARPPSQPCRVRMAAVQGERLRLRDRTIPGRHLRRPQPLATEDCRIVEVDQQRVVIQLNIRKREWKVTAPQHRGGEPLPAKRRELFDDA